MAADADLFIRSTYAAWAGDEQYYEMTTREFVPSSERYLTRLIEREGHLESPTEVMRLAAAVRFQSFLERRGEREFGSVKPDTAAPFVIETNHIRGVLWRIDEREFFLQGYLVDLEWEAELYRRARLQSKLEPSEAGFLIGEPAPEPRASVYEPLGVSWIVPSNPFIRARLSDVGLIEADGIWVGESIAHSDGEIILQAFNRVLQALDEPK